MSFLAWDERAWGGFGACTIASPALFLTAGFLLYVCVCVYIHVCAQKTNTSLWCCLASGVAPLWGEPALRGDALRDALRCITCRPGKCNGLYFWSCSSGWHVCFQAGVCYFIAARSRGWAQLQGVCSGFSMPWDCGGGVGGAGLASWQRWRGGPGLGPPQGEVLLGRSPVGCCVPTEELPCRSRAVSSPWGLEAA